jgi:hypothetical protein
MKYTFLLMYVSVVNEKIQDFLSLYNKSFDNSILTAR